METWSCNIGKGGRVLRGSLGFLALVGGVALFIWGDNDFWATGLCTLGAFGIFEALKGWCALKALGIQLPF
jgi:hypothetical protein